jgi:hypothetical protein
MSFIIHPTTPFSSTEQRRLRSWLDDLSSSSLDAARRVTLRGSSISVEADDDAAHDVALVAMMAVGRPFYYSLAEERRRPQAPALAGTAAQPTAPLGIPA